MHTNGTSNNNNNHHRSTNGSSSFKSNNHEKNQSKDDSYEIMNNLDADDLCTQILQQLDKSQNSKSDQTNKLDTRSKNSMINNQNKDVKKKNTNDANHHEKPKKFFKTSTRRIPIDEKKVYEPPILTTRSRLSSISNDEPKSDERLSTSDEDITLFLSEIPETQFINTESSLPIRRKETKSQDKQIELSQMFQQKVLQILMDDDKIKAKERFNDNSDCIDESMTIKRLLRMNQNFDEKLNHLSDEFEDEFNAIMSGITILSEEQLSPSI